MKENEETLDALTAQASAEFTAEIKAELDALAAHEGDLELASPTQTDHTLARVARTLEEENLKLEKELEERIHQDQLEAEEELAQQIAEDEALRAQEAQDAAESAAAPDVLQGIPDIEDVEACVETLLFMTDKPQSLKKLREYLGPAVEVSFYERALENLKNRYASYHHGIELAEIAGGYQFRTKLSRAEVGRKLTKVQKQRLSRGSMETLAIVAYKQPVMKEDVDKIRGVDSSHFIRGLLERKLIDIKGRSELPGRPMLYGTTQEFLEIFGVKDLASLPPLRELEQMIPNSEGGTAEDEDPKVKEMRKLVQRMNDERQNLSYDPREDDRILTEIRERIKSIAVSTPTLDQMKAQEQQTAEATSVQMELAESVTTSESEVVAIAAATEADSSETHGS